jgi:hypothetical protein
MADNRTRLRTKKQGGATSTALARVGDPLVGPDGRKIDPEGYIGGKPVPKSPSLILEAAEFRPLHKRNLKDLPAEVGTINGVAAVFMYTMLGVGDREIADALRVDVARVEEVRQHTAYRECFDIIVGTFINKNSDLLAARIAAYSHSALDKVGDLSVNATKEETALRASIDLLDRAGVRPKDVEQKGSITKNELRIIVVDGAKDNVTVNVNMGDGEDDIST